MAKYLPYPRREFRRLYRQWVKRNWKVVLALTAGAIASLAAITIPFLMLGGAGAFSYYVLGLMHAVVVASYLALAHSAFLAHERDAIRHLRGAWGEENTRSELQIARRRGLIWGWVDSISLQVGDLDHLVVTRQGGLVALDSKWRSKANATDNLDIARAANRAKLRAEGLAQTLLKRDRDSRHRARSNPLTVRSAVVLWGAAQHAVPHGTQIDGIDFIAGRRLRGWLEQLEGSPVTEEAAADVLERLKTYRAGAWDHSDNPVRHRS